MSTMKFARGGGQACALVGCSNNRKKIYSWKQSTCDQHGVIRADCPCCLPFKLHKLPAAMDENRLRWLSAINRKSLPKEVFVCSAHFVDGQPTQQNPYPTLNLGYDAPVKIGRRVLKRKQTDSLSKDERKSDDSVERKHQTVAELQESLPLCEVLNEELDVRAQQYAAPGETPLPSRTTCTSIATQWIDLSLEDHKYTCIPSVACEPTKPSMTVKTYAEKGVNCRTSHVTMSTSALTTDSLCNLYTGLTLEAFQALVNVFENTDIPFKFTMCVSDQILLTLMKLRLNLLFADLAARFGISESHSSNIFNSWLPFLATVLKDLIIWLPRDTIRATMPSSFQEKYPHTTVIVDCAETFLQIPKNLKTRGETYSHYKSHNTVKYLVGIAPHGQVMFISKGFGGRASDKFIVENSGFLNFLLPGDEVMADRGFTISNLLFPLRAKLNIPAFTRGKSQLSERDVTETRRIAHVRIHVERAIRRLKVFKILSDIIPISCAKKVDDILIVCAALVNLGSPLIKQVEENE